MADFLKQRGQTWWFRRRVPQGTFPFPLPIHVAKSLRTSDKRVAVTRARMAWVQSEELLRAMAQPDIALDQARLLLRRFSQEDPWNPAPDLKRVYDRAAAGDARDADDLLTVARPDLLSLPRDDRARALLHVRNLLDALDMHGEDKVASLLGEKKPTDAEAFGLVVAHAQHAQESYWRAKSFRAVLAEAAEQQADAPPPTTVASLCEEFLAEKGRKTRDTKPLTDNALYQMRLTFRLWTECMGAIPMKAVTGREADRFRKELLRLPASHGKARGVTPSMPDAIAAADKKEEKGQDVPRLTMKTTKRHWSAMLGLWKWAMLREHVAAVPFSGFEFPGTKSSANKREDWSDGDLLTLLRSGHMHEAAAARSRDWWLVAVAMWTGARMEEICRLRPGHDIEEMDDMPCIRIQEQVVPRPWSPKTEAGARDFPVHPMLVRAGLVDLARERAHEERIVPGLVHSGPLQNLGSAPSREFSRLKVGLGVADKTVFHSFRHNVSTCLRNAKATIRTEWIDSVVGHVKKASEHSEGGTTYYKRTAMENRRLTVEAIRYPEPVERAFLDLVERSRSG